MSHVLPAVVHRAVLIVLVLVGSAALPSGAAAKGTGTSTPTAVPGLGGVVDLDAWGFQNCAVLVDGSVHCWGSVGYDGPADYPGGPANRTAPVKVQGLGAAKKVSGRCAVLADGTIWCWGPTWLSAAPDPVDAPAQVAGIDGATDLDVGDRNVTCALKQDATVWCWGDRRFGATGTTGNIFTGQTHASPAQVPGVSGAVGVTVGEQHSCAVLASGALWCWGTGPRLGGGAAPKEIEGFSGVTQASASVTANCLLAGTNVHCFGDNAWGEMGVRPDGLATGALPVQGLPPMAQVDTAEAHTCAVTQSGEGRCWGLEDDGRLGNPVYRGDGTSESPVPVLGLAGIVRFAAGAAHTCALLTDATIACFGSDSVGQLGNGAAPLPADPSPDTPGATIPAASSVPLPKATPTPTPTPQATQSGRPTPTLARSGKKVTLTGIVLTVRKGKRCPAKVTVDVRRKRTLAPTVRKRMSTTTTAGGACTVSGSLTLPRKLAGRNDLALSISGPAITTLTRAVPALAS